MFHIVNVGLHLESFSGGGDIEHIHGIYWNSPQSFFKPYKEGIQSICEEYGAWSVSLPDRPPSVRETATLYSIDDYNSEVVAVQVVQSVDHLFVQSLR